MILWCSNRAELVLRKASLQFIQCNTVYLHLMAGSYIPGTSLLIRSTFEMYLWYIQGDASSRSFVATVRLDRLKRVQFLQVHNVPCVIW